MAITAQLLGFNVALIVSGAGGYLLLKKKTTETIIFFHSTGVAIGAGCFNVAYFYLAVNYENMADFIPQMLSGRKSTLK